MVSSTSQFRAPPPPDMTSADYTAAYNEVKSLGGDGIVTPTQRTEEQTFIGTFWAYDGTPSLCAPPRLYNQITVQIADQRRLGAIQFARLLALVNTAMADAGMTIWESKYYYDFWRPVPGIRESDPGTVLQVLAMAIPTPLAILLYAARRAGQQSSLARTSRHRFPHILPGHAGFGGAIFEIMRRFYGTDNVVSRSFPMSSMGKRAITMETSGPISRVVFQRCHRPRKRTARAGFISGSTGPLIRRKESPLGGVWRLCFRSRLHADSIKVETIFPFLLKGSQRSVQPTMVGRPNGSASEIGSTPCLSLHGVSNSMHGRPVAD